MEAPTLYIFDPDNPSVNVIEITLDNNHGEYKVESYMFLSAADGGVCVSFLLSVDDLKFFICIKENRKQKVAFSGQKSSLESADPIIVYTCDSGESYQFSIKI